MPEIYCCICGVSISSNAGMHSLNNSRSMCIICHHHYRQNLTRSTQIESNDESSFTPEMKDEFILKMKKKQDQIKEKHNIVINTEAYVDKRLANIGEDTDKSENKADEQPIKYIPVSECIDGCMYRIRARNGRIGVFHKDNDNAFTLSRHKFNDNFFYDEYHWDNGEPHGTVMPLECLGKAPAYYNNDELLDYLNELTVSVPGEEYPEFKELRDKGK